MTSSIQEIARFLVRQMMESCMSKNSMVMMIGWRNMIAARLEAIMEKYPPRMEIDVDALADMFSSTLEGGIILARVYGDNKALVDQVQAYRSHLRLVFGDIS